MQVGNGSGGHPCQRRFMWPSEKKKARWLTRKEDAGDCLKILHYEENQLRNVLAWVRVEPSFSGSALALCTLSDRA